MAELFRVKATVTDGEWRDAAGSCLCYVRELDANVYLPSGVTHIDLVAHSRPARDRFRAVVARRRNREATTLLLSVWCLDCDRHLSYHNLPLFGPLFGQGNSKVHLALRRARLGVDTVIYLQVEY